MAGKSFEGGSQEGEFEKLPGENLEGYKEEENSRDSIIEQRQAIKKEIEELHANYEMDKLLDPDFTKFRIVLAHAYGQGFGGEEVMCNNAEEFISRVLPDRINHIRSFCEAAEMSEGKKGALSEDEEGCVNYFLKDNFPSSKSVEVDRLCFETMRKIFKALSEITEQDMPKPYVRINSKKVKEIGEKIDSIILGFFMVRSVDISKEAAALGTEEGNDLAARIDKNVKGAESPEAKTPGVILMREFERLKSEIHEKGLGEKPLIMDGEPDGTIVF